MNKIDFLIIGQGLAGSLLGWELMKRGFAVVIVDNGIENASKVAAGLINPITGMRFVKSNDVDTLLPAARSCYRRLEAHFHQSFFIEKPMVRIFKGETEVEGAIKRLKNRDYEPYIAHLETRRNQMEPHSSPFGFLEQRQTGYLLTRPLLNALRDYFINHQSYLKTDFNYQEIEPEPHLKWRGLYPGQIIFCEGYQAIHNPWFSWLPFQPVKGEILTLQHETTIPDKILNYGNWLIPVTSNQIKIGATYDREHLNTHVTQAAKDELLARLGELSPGLVNASVINHEANVRPGTLDRNPFIGHHPKFNKLLIFNGFGSKGSLQIPWYSCHFAEYLLNASPLIRTCDIHRYVKTHLMT
jgi:glycine/D-amino acid oxidase-like deaminating enzyme